MNFKHPLFFVSIALILVEIVILAIMPSTDPTILNEHTDPMQLEYVPYMMIALTTSFVAGFIFFISGIVFILKSSLKKNLPAIIGLLMAFVIPVIVYQVLLG